MFTNKVERVDPRYQIRYCIIGVGGLRMISQEQRKMLYELYIDYWKNGLSRRAFKRRCQARKNLKEVMQCDINKHQQALRYKTVLTH